MTMIVKVAPALKLSDYDNVQLNAAEALACAVQYTKEMADDWLEYCKENNTMGLRVGMFGLFNAGMTFYAHDSSLGVIMKRRKIIPRRQQNAIVGDYVMQSYQPGKYEVLTQEEYSALVDELKADEHRLRIGRIMTAARAKKVEEFWEGLV